MQPRSKHTPLVRQDATRLTARSGKQSCARHEACHGRRYRGGVWRETVTGATRGRKGWAGPNRHWSGSPADDKRSLLRDRPHLGHLTKLNKFSKLGIIQTTFTDHKGIKPDASNTTGKSLNIWKSNRTHQNSTVFSEMTVWSRFPWTRQEQSTQKRGTWLKLCSEQTL